MLRIIWVRLLMVADNLMVYDLNEEWESMYHLCFRASVRRDIWCSMAMSGFFFDSLVPDRWRWFQPYVRTTMDGLPLTTRSFKMHLCLEVTCNQTSVCSSHRLKLWVVFVASFSWFQARYSTQTHSLYRCKHSPLSCISTIHRRNSA